MKILELLQIIADFNLLSWELYNFMFTLLYLVIYILILYQIKINLQYLKNIVVFPTCSRFPVKLICCIAFISASSVCYIVKSIVINL